MIMLCSDKLWCFLKASQLFSFTTWLRRAHTKKGAVLKADNKSSSVEERRGTEIDTRHTTIEKNNNIGAVRSK